MVFDASATGRILSKFLLISLAAPIISLACGVFAYFSIGLLAVDQVNFDRPLPLAVPAGKLRWSKTLDAIHAFIALLHSELHLEEIIIIVGLPMCLEYLDQCLHLAQDSNHPPGLIGGSVPEPPRLPHLHHGVVPGSPDSLLPPRPSPSHFRKSLTKKSSADDEEGRSEEGMELPLRLL